MNKDRDKPNTKYIVIKTDYKKYFGRLDFRHVMCKSCGINKIHKNNFYVVHRYYNSIITDSIYTCSLLCAEMVSLNLIITK